MSIVKQQPPEWLPSNHPQVFLLSFDILLGALEHTSQVLKVKSTLGGSMTAEFSFLLDKMLRGFMEKPNLIVAPLVIKGIYLFSTKLDTGIDSVLYTFQYLKSKKFNQMSYLTLCLLNLLTAESAHFRSFYTQLIEAKKVFEFEKSLVGLSESLIRKVEIIDKFIELPFKPFKLLSPSNLKLSEDLVVTKEHIYQLLCKLDINFPSVWGGAALIFSRLCGVKSRHALRVFHRSQV